MRRVATATLRIFAGGNMEINNTAILSVDDTNLTASSTITRIVDYSNLILLTKQASTSTATVGDTVTYTITISAGGIGVTPVCATLADALHANLQFVAGSMTINGESSDNDIAKMEITIEQNQITIITYQCIML